MVDTLRNTLRQQLRAHRRSIPPAAQSVAAEAFTHRCLPLIEHATTVSAYLAIQGELSLAPMIDVCHQRGVRVVVPIVEPEQLLFAVYDEHTVMRRGSFGIEAPDPQHATLVPAEAIDVALMPLTGFDRHCHRIGMGGGYYDRTFAFRRNTEAPPLLVGCAHDSQEVPSTHPDWWDVPLDHVVTDQRVLTRQTLLAER